MTGNGTAGDIAGQVEALLDEVTEPRARERMEDLVRLLMEFYGAGLERVVELAGAETVAKLAADDLVGSLLILHDLHPVDTATRVQAALDKVRPYLGSHAGGVTLLGIDDDLVLHLRLEGTCDGCPASRVTVKSGLRTRFTAFVSAPEVDQARIRRGADRVVVCRQAQIPSLKVSVESGWKLPSRSRRLTLRN